MPLDASFGGFGDADISSEVSVDVADGGTEGGSVEGGSPGDGDGGDAGSTQSATSDAGSLPAQAFAACRGPDAGPPLVLGPLTSPCLASSIVISAVTVVDPGGAALFSASFQGAVPVDIALSADGSHIATVAPGNIFTPSLSTVFEFSTCSNTADMTGNLGDDEPVAVAFDASNRVLVQTREPASLWIIEPRARSKVSLSTVTRKDTGHDIFHVQAGGMIACASCHPEGGDDGHIWNLDGSSRRTPSLRGTIAGTAPYHWPGDMKDLPMLFDDVYTRRMSGVKLANDQVSVLKRWVEAVPAPMAPSWVDSAAATRGKAVFESASVGCAVCHSGAKFTNNQTLAVGTGAPLQPFQVPPLVGVGCRAPFLHNGCASTLADRFGSCATPGHGNTSQLSSGEISDLVAYLETL
jgi:mono/diheme cytochrome c family protein